MPDSASHPQQLVVIGASAGGIDALSVLVSTLPTPFPAPIVIAQHLNPKRESHLAQILARRSTLPVRTVQEREQLENGVVFVVPSNRHVEIVDGHIHLREPAGERAKPSVDRLLSTSAAIYGEDLIAVILTGTGSDGTVGARRVKDAGGTVIIQDPSTASFGAMPASLAPSTVDIVCHLERIGPLLGDLLRGVPVSSDGHDDRALRGLLDDVRARSGIDFHSYKPSTLRRRLQRRIVDTAAGDVEGYARYLRSHPEENQRLINTFLIKVTEFMRDPDLFAYLRETTLPQLITDARKRGNELRIWSAGCATGEEAYSLAIQICEILGDALQHFTVRVFATDLDAEAIAFARRGIYPTSALEGLSPEIRARYFTEVDGSFQVSKLVRGLVVFGVHDLVQRAPFPRIDLVLCRNVLIYFTSELQKRTLQLFAFSMRDGGYLVLGKAETTSPFDEAFTLEDPQHKVYKRHGVRVPIPTARTTRPGLGSDLAHRARLALDVAAMDSPRAPPRRRAARKSWMADLPVGVVILNPRYDIFEINPAARKLLGIHRPATGEDLVHLIQSPVQDQRLLRAALQAALQGESPPPLRDFPIGSPMSAARYVEISCCPQVRDPDGERARAPIGAGRAEGRAARSKVESVLVLVQDMTASVEEESRLRASNLKRRALEQELRAAVAALEAEAEALRADGLRRKDEIAALSTELAGEQANKARDGDLLARHLEQIGELRVANEELAAVSDRLQSSNDEFVLSNEEVQASTEGVETVNEEFQATNEELETLNEEFQATIEELNTTNEDLEARGRELSDLTRAAEAERVRLSAVLVGIGDGVLVVDRDGRIELTSAAFDRMFQGSLPQILDESGSPVPPEQMPEVRAARGESFRMEFALPAQDSGPRDFEAIGQPIHDQDGKCQGGVVVIRDVTDRGIRRLQDRFLAMASHELRTPLVPLKGYLQLLQRTFTEGGSQADRIRYAQSAVTQVQRLRDLVNELVDVSRFQSGTFQLSCAPVDFGALIAQAIQSTEPLTEGQGIHAEIEPGPWMVHGDAARLEQVIVNLLTNAVKYAPNTGPIEVRVRRVDSEVELEVEDHGPGIPAAEIPRLFWPFYQVTSGERSPRGGLGLGLFICSEIITSHGGRIAVRSASEHGAVFTVRLRLLPDTGRSS